MKRLLMLGAALLLAGCVSTAMRGYVGKPIEEVFMAYGRPVGAIDLHGGQVGYQFPWGGGSIVLPAQTTGNVTSYGNVTTFNATTAPARAVNVEPCIVTFIAASRSPGARVVDYRVPARAFC